MPVAIPENYYWAEFRIAGALVARRVSLLSIIFILLPIALMAMTATVSFTFFPAKLHGPLSSYLIFPFSFPLDLPEEVKQRQEQREDKGNVCCNKKKNKFLGWPRPPSSSPATFPFPSGGAASGIGPPRKSGPLHSPSRP